MWHANLKKKGFSYCHINEKSYLAIEFQIPFPESSSDSKSTFNLSGFFCTRNLTMCDLNELISTLISVEFRGVSEPS